MRPESDVVLGGRYALIRRIAIGGMGEVWEATDTLLGRQVAVKILREEFRSAPAFRARFRAEARHAGQLNHPGIAAVYDYGETAEMAFLVMELVNGRPLSELIAGQPPLTDVAKLSVLAQSAEALQAAHDSGVVHRDVKPGNLMVRPDGTVKVTDFGIARALTSASLTDHGQMIGTPAYVSPEQASGGQVTGASDIYSLGVVAYEMFAGQSPFERDTPFAITLAQVHDSPPPLPDTVPRPVAELIGSALAKDPSQRPSSAAFFAAQLRREMAAMQRAPTAPTLVTRRQDTLPMPSVVSLSANDPGQRTLVGPPGANHPEFRRNSYVAVAVFACLLVIIGAAVLVATRSRSGDDARADLPAVSSTSAPVIETEPLPTEPPPTEPSATEPPPTEPPPTEPLPIEPLPTEPPPPAKPSSGAATPAGRSDGGDRIAEGDAIAFVVDYYERIAAADYATAWELLSPEFREARNLTFERYVSYWEETSIELEDLHFVPGPGADQGRVRFQARYDTGAEMIDEKDEVTLRRLADGRLIISEQRIV